MHILTVDQAEHGMKLIGFLARRFEGGVPTGELHRWIRTGQIRLNGKRARAFDRIAAGDAVRLPPFAAGSARHETPTIPVHPGDILGENCRVLAVAPDFLALEKPAHLPSQPGSKQDTSVSDLLRAHFQGSAYVPAPAHRLDKMTSGILLAGRTHEAQERLHALFSRKDGTTIEKAYLAWVGGAWPYTEEHTLTDFLAKKTGSGEGRETVRATDETSGKEARSRVSFLERRDTTLGTVSLLRILLETGRTHQIRAQLSIRNFPIIGDIKYGGKPFSHMLLHAHSLTFPWNDETVRLASLPAWPAPFVIAPVLNVE